MTHRSELAQAKSARLRLLATSDLHMQLKDYDYMADNPSSQGSLTQLGPVITKARAEAEDAGATVLLVDNGDSLQGPPLGDMAAQDVDQKHPLMQMFTHLGYDVLGLGNHDFDFGLETLRGILEQSPCPVVCSNLSEITPLGLPITPSLILDVAHPSGVIKVGFFSCLPPQTMMWNADTLSGKAKVLDIVETAQAQAQDLRRQECDVVIALAHSGLGVLATDTENAENAALRVAALAEIDVVVAGHSHRQYACDAVVQPGASGSHLGVVDLELGKTPEGGWCVLDTKAGLRPASESPDPALDALIAPQHAQAVSQLNTVVGQTEIPLHSYFGLFAPDPCQKLCAQMQATALSQHIPASYTDLPILSAVAPSRFGGRSGPSAYTDIPAGPLRERHILDICIFDNKLAAAVLSGAQIRDWLEMSAGLFLGISPGETRAILNPNFAGHNFDSIYGLTYEIDLSQPAKFDPDGNLVHPDSSRIRHLSWNGSPIDPNQRFVVAMTSYRIGGGGNIPALHNVSAIKLPKLPLRDLLRTWWADKSTTTFAQRFPWRFASIPNATAIVTTGPGAERYLGSPNIPALTPLGLNAQGFLELQLPLDSTWGSGDSGLAKT